MNILTWAATASVGSRVQYGRRNYSEDPAALDMANAYAAHSQGLVFLAQRRRKDGTLLYEATRISPKTTKMLQRISEDRP
jgi:hypothetical protein